MLVDLQIPLSFVYVINFYILYKYVHFLKETCNEQIIMQ